MVQYFAENLDGFAVTQNGWCSLRVARDAPSILWGDVSRPAPITVRWSTFAPVAHRTAGKGMLTGPVTILAWSFLSRRPAAAGRPPNQVALALRDEIVRTSRRRGIRVIQVDEPRAARAAPP
jgi:5-methyltetrahydropteroyltriglutamate--homocysteine methyltransferase